MKRGLGPRVLAGNFANNSACLGEILCLWLRANHGCSVFAAFVAAQAVARSCELLMFVVCPFGAAACLALPSTFAIS